MPSGRSNSKPVAIRQNEISRNGGYWVDGGGVYRFFREGDGQHDQQQFWWVWRGHLRYSKHDIELTS